MDMKRVAQCITVLAAILIASPVTLSSLKGNMADQATTQLGNIERLDARLDRLVPKNARLEKLCDGYHWVEGPVWNRKENYLLFSDIPANAIIKWKAGDGMKQYLKPSGYTGSAPFEGREPGSNGLTYDAAGRLI